MIKRKIIDLLIAEKYTEKEIKEIEDESKNLNNDEINRYYLGYIQIGELV